MSGAAPNDSNRSKILPFDKRQSKPNQTRRPATNVVQAKPEMPPLYEDDFPTLQAATSKQTTTAASATSVPRSNKKQPVASSIHETQYSASNHPSLQSDPMKMTDDIQPLMPSTQPSSEPQTIHVHTRSTGEKRPPPMSMHLGPQPTTTRSNITTDNNSSPATTTPRPPTARENDVNRQLCRIILETHTSKEFVALEVVERQLFQHFNVSSWNELRVHPLRINAFINHSDYLKNVTFYLHIFEQIFHLCTLKDFEHYLIKFLKVQKYEDALLGPLHKHPEVQRVFKYKLLNSDQSTPAITTGEVVQQFMQFEKEHRHQRMVPFEEFFDRLVKLYQLQSREQLGIFYRSPAYLKQVIGSVRRDEQSHTQHATEELRQELIEQIHARLNEVKEEMRDALELSSFNKKRTPIAVFNHLTSIVEKYFDIVRQQPALYAILIQLRDDDLLQCLFNLSIYLGTIDQPEVFITELKKLYESQERNPQTTMQQLPVLDGKVSKKDRKKLNAMIQQQQQVQSSSTNLHEENTTVSTPIDTSFARSLSTSRPNKPKSPVSLKRLCSEIYTLLFHFHTVLTIEQLHEIDRDLCARHGVGSFSVFSYDEHNSDDQLVDFVSFLEKHRQLIDPNDELSVYEHTASSSDQTELYLFVQQLSALNNEEANEEHQQQQHVTLVHGHLNAEQLHMSAEKLSAVEKAVKHKFGESISARKRKQLITKAKKQRRQHQSPLIRFEESLLDVHGLNRLDTSPASLNVDETQLCQSILHCPLMTDLHTWLQWRHFFQPKYGALRSFLDKHEQKFKDLCLLETSNRELFRLPVATSLTIFEEELNALHIRTAVGHLCALIMKEGLVTQFSFNVYRTSMITWFRHLRSLKTVQSDYRDPMEYILEFITYLPELISQSRTVEELILRPLDEVFGNERVDGMNTRTRVWNLADSKQRIKLELWGYTINVIEWQNENKWLGCEDAEARVTIRSENGFVQTQNLDMNNPVVSVTTSTESLPVSTSDVTATTSTDATAVVHMDGEDESAQTAFDHIETIRRGFGVDSTLDSNGQSIVTNLQGMVARSLEKLSNDLYSDQGHFVLELIQNADDNQYIAGCLPTLRFILSPERILVCNNEVGFQPANIEAICNVGASTKGKHKEGYAGHKGIGFKSVFMISHKPEIHSRNYHLRFDTVDGKDQIAYVRPIWIDKYEETLPNVEEWTTCIRLPIKKDAQRIRLQENFDDIQPRLLLFLNRLRQIEIINQSEMSSTEDNKRVFTRIDHAQGQIIELQEKASNKPLVTNYWLVIKKVISVPNNIKMKLRDVKGEVDSTTIAIAYPLSNIQESSTQLPPIQPLFAYLPLRPYGFRFILQADFEIPATRQEIRRDNLWNDWLKSEMTCLLYSAYHQFQCLPELLASSSINTQINAHLTPIQMIKYFLKLIPSRSELSSYFNTFVDESIKLLMGIIELPVARQDEKGETSISWVPPSQCIIVKDPLIQKILSQDLLLSHFNCYYVHEQLALECDEQILLKLGCRQLEFMDIIQLIESSYKQDEQKHLKTTSSIEQVGQWLVCLDYSLEQQRHEMSHTVREKDIIAKVKQLKILPLKQQSYFVSVDEFDKHGILFPLNKATQYSKYLKLVLDDVPTLDEQLFNFIEDKHPRRLDSIKHLLQKLGISGDLNILGIYRQHILPVMSDAARWSLKSESILIAYLLCIYESIYLFNRDTFDSDLKILQNTMVIKTRDNTFVSLGSADVVVHLTSKYSPKMSLDTLKLSNYKLTFISDDYYNLFRADISRTEKDKYNFISFLKDLNVDEFFQVNFITNPFVQVSQLADTQWAYMMRPLSEKIYDLFKIKDYRCEEFNKLLAPSDENQTPDLELCIQLLQYLDEHHPTVCGNYAATIVLTRGDKYGQGTPIQAIESSFCLALRQHAWIPVDGGLLCKPSEVYCLRPNSETAAFRRYVPHLDTSRLSLRNEDFVYNILRIKSDVTHQMMFELLMKWSCNLDSESLWSLVKQSDATEIIPCSLSDTFRQTCLDTIGNFHRIYRFLASNDETRFLLNRFRLWPLIFIPRDQQTGDFLFVRQTFWNDPIALLSSQDTSADTKGRIPLRPYYNIDLSLQQFFLEILNVASQPTIDDYLPLLSTVQDINQIWQIIQIITQLAVEQNKQDEIQEKCENIAFIPCMDRQKKVVKYTDHPFYPHDKDIVKLFADTLPIIKLPDFDISTEFKEQFCLLFDIENLGKVIQIKTDVENEQSSTSLTNFYRSSIDLIQHFLLSQKLISDTRSSYLLTIFARMQFICVDRIHLSYCYGTDTVKVPSTSHTTDTYIDDQTCKFYILKKFEASEMRYTDAMVYFIVGDEIARSKLLVYIKDLLQIYQNEDMQGLADRREKITERCEPKWTIPEEMKEDVPVVSPPVQETEITTTTEKPEIDEEQIKILMEGPSRRPILPPKATKKEGTNVPDPFLPPLNVRTNSSESKSDGPSERDHTPSPSVSNSNDQNHRAFHDREQDDNEHVVPKDRTGDFIPRDATRKEPNEDYTKPRKDRPIQHHTPLDPLDSASLSPPSFEQIVISTLANFDVFTSASSTDELSASNPFYSTNNEADVITGRQGESIVFQHLKKHHPNDTIKWMNEEAESFEPYDILRMINSDEDRKEFIEVKTTRSVDQNAFPVSIGEVACLLRHPSNYFIYRVYYTDQNTPATITVINKVENNLKLQHIKLTMTIPSLSNA